MKKVLVTGANGFVGGWLVRELVKNGIEVLALDLEGHDGNLAKSELVTFRAFDFSRVGELDNVIADGEYDTFYHFAWIGSAGNGRTDEKLQLNNALWTAECLKFAASKGCKRFVMAGSIMEKEAAVATTKQGSCPGLPYIYGVGKLAAHYICKPIANSLGIELVWAIITNAYGEGERSPRFVNTTIKKIINGEPLQFTSGVQNYDFVYVEDVARAFYLIGKCGKANCEYVIGSSNARPLKEFIIEMKEALCPECELVFGDVPFTGTNMPLEAFSTADTERDTGFHAQISFTDGVRRTMDWLRAEMNK